MNELFPIFLKLRDRRALVVGGGRIAGSRVHQLLACGAKVTVISPEICEALQLLAAAGSIQWLARPFLPSDITRDFFIVVGATDDAVCQQMIAQEAEREGILYNVVDAADHSNFYTPAVVEHGDLKIAISTNGKSPGLAQYLRRQLEQALPIDSGQLVQELGVLRSRLKLRIADPETRKAMLSQLIERLVERCN